MNSYQKKCILMDLHNYESSAWKGHMKFASLLPLLFDDVKTIVDLGVDYGHSTISWGISGNANVYGIDWFEGDIHTGYRNTYNIVSNKLQDLKNKYNYNTDKIHIIKGSFDEVAKDWDKPIDILHIDGEHTTEAIYRDFNNWSRYVKDDGIICFHDTTSFPQSIGAFVNNLDGYYKLYFNHSAGLGVISKSKKKIDLLSSIFF